jgi:hypothetical protein
VARANLDLYSLDRGILSRAQNNQIIQRQQGLVNSSGIPKSQTFFVRPSFSVFAAGGNQSTSASVPQTFTSNFTNQATSQPTIFTTTTTTTTTTTGGAQDLTSGFSSGFTSTLESTAITTITASGGGGINDFNVYGDSREEPNRLISSEEEGFIIYYTSTEVAVTDRASVITRDTRQAVRESLYGVTTFQGVNALQPVSGQGNTFAEDGYYVTTGALSIGTGDFTVEWWANVGTRDDNNVYVVLQDEDYVAQTGFGLGSAYSIELSVRPPGFGVDERRWLTTASVVGVSLDQNSAGISLRNEYNTPLGDTHMCIQRINGVIYFHFNGELRPDVDGLGSIFPTFDIGIGLIEIRAYLASPDPAVYVGQVRLSDRPTYGTGNFTPPPEPFFLV